MDENTMLLKKRARLVGLLYLIWVITGLYGLIYVPSHTIVENDPAATAGKVLANEFVFRSIIVNDIISSILWVFIGLNLYRIFNEVNERLSKILVAFVFVQIPVVFIMEAFHFTSLFLFKGDILKTFSVSQQQDLGFLFLKINAGARIALEMYWGLWLLPFGILVYRSKFIPRILGIFLIANGIAFIIHFFVQVLLPDYNKLVYQFATPFWILGEISIMLWLLIKGIKTKY